MDLTNNISFILASLLGRVPTEDELKIAFEIEDEIVNHVDELTNKYKTDSYTATGKFVSVSVDYNYNLKAISLLNPSCSLLPWVDYEKDICQTATVANKEASKGYIQFLHSVEIEQLKISKLLLERLNIQIDSKIAETLEDLVSSKKTN